ncbi:hypothetical protein Tco_1175523 [Tanacetum coccineum]
MPTEMELSLEQTQQGVSYEVSVFTMKMEILLEPTSNKLMVAGNPVKKILLKLNLSDHRILKDGGEVIFMDTAYDRRWIRRIGNCEYTFSCEDLALIRRISFPGYGVLVRNE